MLEKNLKFYKTDVGLRGEKEDEEEGRV